MNKSGFSPSACVLSLWSLSLTFAAGQTPASKPPFTPGIPRVWDEAALASLQLPLADPAGSPGHVPAEYYYRIPARPIYRSYPVYHPDREPPGYMEWLKQQKPEKVWDDANGIRPSLKTEADWRKAGELVFDAPIAYDPGLIGGIITSKDLRDLEWYRKTGMPVAADGTMPFARYVIRTSGLIEVGNLACAYCHTRVMGNTVIPGAQGNLPFDRAIAARIRADAALRSPDGELGTQRFLLQLLFDTPWLKPDPLAALKLASFDDLAGVYEAIPGGVLARHGTSPANPVQVPDLIGLKGRTYLDRTGLMRHRGVGDVMRYAALNQGGDLLARHGEFIPGGEGFKVLPDPGAPAVGGRYSDEQLYALALFLYSITPPENVHLPRTPEQRAVVLRGEAIFKEEGCSKCHDPKQGYTNNKLVAAPGFDVPNDHPAKADIMRNASGMPRRIGSDPTLTLTTRRGTGFYKVPSLLGVWYRGPFEHNGSCATLEDWFNPARTNDPYVPTGWKGPPGTKTRAVKGHEFGLDLSEEERRALIAFLRSL